MRTRSLSALVSGFVVGLMIALAPSCGSTGGSTGGGAGGSGGTGGSGGSSGAGGGTSSAFCTDFSNAYCDFGTRCNFVAANQRSECLALINSFFCSNAKSLAKGYQSMSSSNGMACVAGLTAATCDDFSSVFVTYCLSSYTPTVATGGACAGAGDCVDLNNACTGVGCNLTCAPGGAVNTTCPQNGVCNTGLRCDSTTRLCLAPHTVGQTCAPYYTNECDATTTCDVTSKVCVVLPVNGQTCRVSSPRCAGGLYCNGTTTTCSPKLAQGVMCTYDACQDGLFCDYALTPDSCQPKKLAGGTCQTFGDQCATGLECIGGFCATPRTEGQSCSGYYDCASSLTCDAVLRTCQKGVYSIPVGQSCTGSARNCTYSLVCKGRATNSDGGVGTVGNCAAPALGDPCSSNSGTVCPSHSFCNFAVDGGAGTCVASTTGAPCGSTSNCPASDYCAPSGLCSARLSAGATCTSYDSCASGKSCIQTQVDGGSSCGTAGDLGAACVPSSSGSNPCLFPYSCVNKVCARSGHANETCVNDSYCFDGLCNHDAGRCTGVKGAGGELCTLGTECLSGSCNNAHCTTNCP